MKVIEAISKMIEDAGYGEEGVTLFHHEMPEACAKGIVLRLPIEGVPVDHCLPGYLKTKLQVILRDGSHASGDARAREIMDLLTFHENREFAVVGEKTLRINHCLPRTEPIIYPRSGSRNIEWAITFDVNSVEFSL